MTEEMQNPMQNDPSKTNEEVAQSTPASTETKSTEETAAVDELDLPKQPQTDLLTEISREDKEKEAAEAAKAKRSFGEDFSRFMARVNLFFQADIRKNIYVFMTLKFTWIALVCLLLLGGLASLFVVIYGYTSFPNHIKTYMRDNNIVLDETKQTRFSLSDLEVQNIKDKAGTYEIRSALLRYRFADLLKKKIQNVNLDGVKVIVKEGENGFDFGGLPKLLLRITQQTKNTGMKINNIALTNAVVEISGQKFKLPIYFSLTGVYEGVSKLVVPLTVREEYINMTGNLTITAEKNGAVTWEIDDITGVLSFPSQSPENVKGKISVKTQKAKLSSFKGNINLSYGQNSKVLDLNLDKKANGLLSGTMKISLKEVTAYDKTKTADSDITIKLDGLDFKKGFHLFETQKPIVLNIQSFKRGRFELTGASGTLNGHLVCQKFNCTYKLTAPSSFSSGKAQFDLGNNVAISDKPLSFTLLPTKSDQSFSFNEGKIDVDLLLSNIFFSGYKNTRLTPIQFKSALMGVQGAFNMNAPQKRLNLEMNGLNYTTPDYQMTDAFFYIEDLFAASPTLKVSTPNFVLKDNSLIKAPFKLDLIHQNQKTMAEVSLEKDVIRLAFEGAVDFNNGQIIGDIIIPSFDLADVKRPLNQVSSLFPDFVHHTTGKVGVIGSIFFKNARQVEGPIYISLKDISTQTDNLKVSGLNTVLAFSSLEPLMTAGAQRVFIEKINGPLPLVNVSTNFQIDNQYAYLYDLSGYLGNIELVSETVLIPSKSRAVQIAFHNNNIDLSLTGPYLNLPVNLTGKATASFPVELKNGSASIKGGEIKFSSATISAKTKSDRDKMKSLFQGRDTYTVRNGFVSINSQPTSNTSTIQLMLETRSTETGNRTFRKDFTRSLGSLISPLSGVEVPASIREKQQLFNF